MVTDTSWWPFSTPQLPASPQQPPSRVTRAPARASSAASADHPSTAAWWQCGWATISVPARDGGSQPGVAVNSSASVRVACATRSAAAPPTSSSASLRSTAVQEGSTPTIGQPASAAATSDSTVPPRMRRARSSWPVVIQVSPQQVSAPGTCTR
jgi:hypothetical protein